jgi:diacylglycerol kinase (ATP)
MPARRLLVIYNPMAGRGSARRVARFLAELERLGAAAELRPTEARGHAELLARAAGANCDAVVAAGGDGTINEIVNGLPPDMPLAVLPVGTGNVLANEIGLPRDPSRLAAIAAFGAPAPAWTGEIVDAAGRARRFVMMAGIGFDAAVVAGLDSALKRRIGKLAFVWEILRQLRRDDRRRYRLRIDGREHEVASAVICNGRFYAGRFVLAPEAALEEPSLELVLFARDGRVAALRYLAAMTLGATHHLADVRILRVASLTALGPAGAPVEADGDIVAHLPATIEIAPRPLLLIRPSGASSWSPAPSPS